MKAELRKKILQEMKALSQKQKQAMDRVLTERILNHSFYQEAKTIATYLSFPHEFQTQGSDTQNLSQGAHGLCGLRSAAVGKNFLWFTGTARRLGSGGTVSD